MRPACRQKSRTLSLTHTCPQPHDRHPNRPASHARRARRSATRTPACAPGTARRQCAQQVGMKQKCLIRGPSAAISAAAYATPKNCQLAAPEARTRHAGRFQLGRPRTGIARRDAPSQYTTGSNLLRSSRVTSSTSWRSAPPGSRSVMQNRTARCLDGSQSLARSMSSPDDYDYELPKHLIAQHPLRGGSMRGCSWSSPPPLSSTSSIRDLPTLLRTGRSRGLTTRGVPGAAGRVPPSGGRCGGPVFIGGDQGDWRAIGENPGKLQAGERIALVNERLQTVFELRLVLKRTRRCLIATPRAGEAASCGESGACAAAALPSRRREPPTVSVQPLCRNSRRRGRRRPIAL